MPGSWAHRAAFFCGACLLARWAAGTSLAPNKMALSDQVPGEVTCMLSTELNAYPGTR